MEVRRPLTVRRSPAPPRLDSSPPRRTLLHERFRNCWGGPRCLTPTVVLPYTEKTPMYYLLLAVHIVVCIFLIIVVLLQSGKAADLAGAFGGLGSQTAFGPRGSATLLSKATTISAVVFMITSLSLSIMATRNAGLSSTVLEDRTNKPVPAKNAPAAPTKTTIPVPGQPAPVTPGNTQQQTIPLPAPTPAPAKK